MKPFTIALAAILLAACSTGPADVGNPPAIAVQSTPASAAGRDIEAQQAEREAQAIRDAADIAIAEATAEAQRQADAIAAVTAQVQAEERARSVELTRVNDAIVQAQESDNATATHEAGIAQAAYQIAATGTAEKIANDAYAARQQEQELAIIKEANASRRGEIRSWAFTIIVALFIIGLAVVGVVSAWNIGRAKEIKILAGAYADMAKITPSGGVLTLANSNLDYEPRLLPAPIIEGELAIEGSGEIDTLGRIPRTTNGQEQDEIIIKRDRNPERTNKVLVHKLLKAARDYADITNGPRDIIPGYRNLHDFNADMWMRATDILDRNKVIKKKARRATKFLDNWDIDTALMEGNLNRLNYSPAPPA